MPSGFGRLELATGAGFAEVRDFYLARLRAAGFDMQDHGVAPLNAAAAAWLGIAGNLSGLRADIDDAIAVIIRTADGLIPSRIVELRWSKTSETPQPPAGVQAQPQ